jgi:hypothetical protein
MELKDETVENFVGRCIFDNQHGCNQPGPRWWV